MAAIASLVGVLCIGITILYLLTWGRTLLTKADRPPLPPGPRGFPLIGNVNDFPSSDTLAAQHWLKHKALYGNAQIEPLSRDISLRFILMTRATIRRPD